MKLSVFFQTWSSPWASSVTSLDLSTIAYPIDRVYLAFVNPQTNYILGSNTFSGTGVDFSTDFNVVRDGIDVLHTRGIEVILSAGGATYSFENYNAQGVVDLCKDLHCDGIDLDWEPINGFHDNYKLALIIEDFKSKLGDKKLCLTAWSTGAYTPNGDVYQGMNIYGIVQKGASLDWLNIMSCKFINLCRCFNSMFFRV